MTKSELIAECRVITDWIESQPPGDIDTGKAAATVRMMIERFDKSFTFDVDEWNQPAVRDAMNSIQNQVQSSLLRPEDPTTVATMNSISEYVRNMAAEHGRIDSRASSPSSGPLSPESIREMGDRLTDIHRFSTLGDADDRIFFHPGTIDDFRRTVDGMNEDGQNRLISDENERNARIYRDTGVNPMTTSIGTFISGLSVIDRPDLDPPGVYVGTMRALRRAGVVPPSSPRAGDSRIRELIREGRIGPR